MQPGVWRQLVDCVWPVGSFRFYPGEAARLQCGRRAVQRLCKKVCSGIDFDPVCTSGTFCAAFQEGLQCLPETELIRKAKGSLGDLCAISAEAPPFSTPACTLCRGQIWFIGALI